jgi:hypothetical protein
MKMRTNLKNPNNKKDLVILAQSKEPKLFNIINNKINKASKHLNKIRDPHLWFLEKLKHKI